MCYCHKSLDHTHECIMVSRKYTTLTAPSVANFSTAPAAQRTKPSGCVKIGL